MNSPASWQAYPGESPVVFELARPGDFVVRIQSRAPRGVAAGR